ncbi:Interleukin-17A [Trichinella papuae]|uniref:Interleukin-17A n=1 Tax=Trichinella papuae TaxID=268474 RepID=A0A0V1MTA6_9BILA|nr:Interleukin-17A [Trichinella papuae]
MFLIISCFTLLVVLYAETHLQQLDLQNNRDGHCSCQGILTCLDRCPSRFLKPVLDQSNLCDKDPFVEFSTHLKDRSLCPWIWHRNRDPMRKPEIIAEARCMCKRARGLPMAECIPMHHKIPVLRKHITYKMNNKSTFTYKTEYMKVTVGCYAAMPKTKKVGRFSHPLLEVLRQR